jgi:hypothetical protein
LAQPIAGSPLDYEVAQQAGTRERHLRRISIAYIEHYHEESNHQSLDNRLMLQRAAKENAVGPVQRRERLGRTLRFYHRDAA